MKLYMELCKLHCPGDPERLMIVEGLLRNQDIDEVKDLAGDPGVGRERHVTFSRGSQASQK